MTRDPLRSRFAAALLRSWGDRPEPAFGFTAEQVARIMDPIYEQADRLMILFILGHFAIALAQAFFYGTWLITLAIGSAATAMFLVSRMLLPRRMTTRIVAGISLQAFVALHIYQLHGLPEMHFYFFTTFTMMIIYQDWLCMWPGALLIIAQHILFATLQNSGQQLYFFPESYVRFTKLFFHFGIAIGQVVICGYWAVILRRWTLQSAFQERQIMQSRDELRQLNAGLEQRVRERTAELAIALEKTQELEQLKTQFFANVSHELRTPLALILGPIERALSDTGIAAKLRDDLVGVRRNSRILLRHVNDLLDVSKLEAGQLQPAFAKVDLARLTRRVASYFEVLAQDREITFQVETPETVAGEVDPEQFQRILMNLLSNAFKFTPAAGRVRCVLEVGSDDGGGRGEPGATLVVADSGPGIPASQRAAVFERFRQLEDPNTRRFGGTGLGLAIVRDFVELHRGSVSVGEAAEGGALFRVTLPLAAPPGASVREEEGPAPAAESAEPLIEELRTPAVVSSTEMRPDGRPVALVVEDNVEMCRFIAETLSPVCQVVMALNGEEGLRKAEAVGPDIILTDVMMPGMSGEQLVAAIRGRRNFDRVPIVLLTAKADDELRARLLHHGAQDYITKPFAAEELQARVQNLVASRRRSEREREQLLDQLHALNADLEERVEARTHALSDSLKEREVLLQEVHHRVKNNLQVISGLISMQVFRLPEGASRDALEECQTRVRAIALIHEMIYRSKNYTGVPFSEYARRLATSVFQAAGISLDIVSLELAIEEVSLPVDKAIPCGLILNELITNALKHAFPQRMRGKVRVELDRVEEARLRLAVKDDGVGLPTTLKIESAESLGMQLIDTLTQQLGGVLTICRDRGTAIQVVFPAEEEAGADDRLASAA